MYILYILNNKTLTTENRSTVLHNFFLLDMSIFNELINKSDPVKKASSFFVFMEGIQLSHYQVLALEDIIFHCKFLSRLYRNNKFNILANIKVMQIEKALINDGLRVLKVP